jgi:putative phage-type endonuclease
MIIEQRSQEWFDIRRGKITSSEFHKILGDGKVKETYLLEKIAEGMGGFAQPAGGPAIEWGIELESTAIDVYTEKTGIVVEKASFMPVNDYYGGSPDGIVTPDGIIEVKCPYTTVKHLKHGLIKSDADFKKTSPEYYYQCISNMICANAQWCDFISFDPRLKTKYQMFIYRLNRDENEVKLMQEKLEAAIKQLQELKIKLEPTIHSQDGAE